MVVAGATVCSISLKPYYIIVYLIKWVKTSWTYSMLDLLFFLTVIRHWIHGSVFMFAHL